MKGRTRKHKCWLFRGEIMGDLPQYIYYLKNQERNTKLYIIIYFEQQLHLWKLRKGLTVNLGHF